TRLHPTGVAAMLLEPAAQRRPDGRAEEHDREVLDLAGLSQRERLEELVERAETARKDHESARVLHEHVLADEEVAELDAEVDVFVHGLLMRQLDVAAHRKPARFVAAAVDGLHEPGAAAGDHRKAAPGELGPQRHSRLVIRIIWLRTG